MGYQINSVDFLLPPTTGRWMPREILGRTGSGHPIYPQIREYECRWQLIDQVSLDQLQDWIDAQGLTGTFSVSLPKFNGNTGTFQTYTNCILTEPERGTYFNWNTMEVVMLIGSIVV